jgi:hypothetical protein
MSPASSQSEAFARFKELTLASPHVPRGTEVKEMSEEVQPPADGDVLKSCHDFWFAFIQKAMKHSSFDALCTLLRPRAMHDAGWDVLDESEATFEDFNWMLKTAHETKGKGTARRLALHHYCFIIEMNPIHEMIMNLVRCVSGQRYLRTDETGRDTDQYEARGWSRIYDRNDRRPRTRLEGRRRSGNRLGRVEPPVPEFNDGREHEAYTGLASTLSGFGTTSEYFMTATEALRSMKFS